MMPKFRKKPVVIEARKVEGSPHEVLDIATWCDGSMEVKVSEDRKGLAPRIQIHTLEGTMQADHGDWIIQGVANEFYPCKPDIFEKNYEPVDD